MKELNVKAFNEFEEKHKMFSFKIDDWYVWPYLRFVIYTEMSDYYNGLTRKYRRDKTDFLKIVKLINNCTFNNPLLRCKKSDFFVLTSSTRVPTKNGYKCFITDEIIENLDGRVSAAELFSREDMGHKTPCYTNDILYLDYIEVLSEILRRLFFVWGSKKTKRNINIFSQRLVVWLEEDFDYICDFQSVKNRLISIYVWHVIKKEQIRKLLKKIEPSVVVEDCYYTASHLLFNEVAHELGAKVVELQHGFISNTHAGYNFNTVKELNVFPDYIILFSEFWKENAKYPIGKDNLLTFGYPYYYSMKNGCVGSEKNKEFTTILVLSQHIYTDKLLEDIRSMCNMLDREGIKYEVLYKLHPMEPYESIKHDELFGRPNVELIDNTKMTLYECFAKADIQIGASSTAIFEGLGYKLHTVLLNYPLVKDAMKSLISKDYVYIANNGIDVAKLILNDDKDCSTEINLFNEEGSLNRIVDFLNNLKHEC